MEAADVEVVLKDGTEVYERKKTNLIPGMPAAVTFRWIASAGVHNLSIHVDPDGIFYEPDTNKRAATVAISVVGDVGGSSSRNIWLLFILGILFVLLGGVAIFLFFREKPLVVLKARSKAGSAGGTETKRRSGKQSGTRGAAGKTMQGRASRHKKAGSDKEGRETEGDEKEVSEIREEEKDIAKAYIERKPPPIMGLR